MQEIQCISLKGQLGNKNPMFGKPAINRRKVKCITTGVEFDSVTSGANFFMV